MLENEDMGSPLTTGTPTIISSDYSTAGIPSTSFLPSDVVQSVFKPNGFNYDGDAGPFLKATSAWIVALLTTALTVTLSLLMSSLFYFTTRYFNFFRT